VIEGTEIVLSMDDSKADIQLVADNSDINYLMGDDESIRDFDLGEDQVSRDEALKRIEKYYPESNFAICPFRHNCKDNKGSDAGQDIYNYFTPSSYGKQILDNNTTVNPQPYVLYILQKVIESLGYTVGYNQLTQTDLFCRIFFLNQFVNEPYNRIAPKMTRQEFIEECEKFFNCVLIADSMTKTVNIYQINTFYQDKPKTYINKVIDEFKKEYDNEDTVNMNYTNVAYGSNYTNIYRRVSKEIVDKCEALEWESFAQLIEKAFSDDYYNKFYIHHVKDDDIEYIPLKKTIDKLKGQYAKVFNRFADIVNEDDEDTDKVELNFIPAEMALCSTGNGIFEVVMDGDSEEEDSDDEDEQEFLDALSNGLEEETVPDFFRIGINAGIQRCNDYSGRAAGDNHYTVQSWIDIIGYNEVTAYKDGSSNGTAKPSFKHGNTELTLALKGEEGLYARFYSKNKKVNTAVKYTISFVTDKILDPKTIFVIGNKEYYCGQLKYTIRANGKDKVCEGEFYPVENSDKQ
jgi:hypothetical protein